MLSNLQTDRQMPLIHSFIISNYFVFSTRAVQIQRSLTNSHRKVKRSEYRMVRKVDDGDDLLTVTNVQDNHIKETDNKVEGTNHVDQE